MVWFVLRSAHRDILSPVVELYALLCQIVLYIVSLHYAAACHVVLCSQPVSVMY